MTQPGPVVTIVDPHAPHLPVTVEPPHDPRRAGWLPWERRLAVLSVVLAVVGTLVAVDLARDPGPLRATAVAGPLRTEVGPDTFVELVAQLRVSRPVEVRSVVASGGWTVRSHQADEVVLTHPLACGPSVPPVLTVVVEEQAVRRTLRLPVVGAASVEVCDPFTAGDGLRIVSSSLHSFDGPLTVEAEVTALTTTPVSITGVGVRGFTFRGTRPLPITVAGRETSRPFVLAEAPTTHLSLRAQVQDCGRARQVLDGLEQTGDQALDVFVSSRGSGYAGELGVPGLTDYLEQQWRATCVR